MIASKKKLVESCYVAAMPLLCALFVACPNSAHSQESSWTSTGAISVVSDNIFRGQSQTWGKPALQASLETSSQAGPYVGLFASNVSRHWLPGAKLELDLYGGIRGKVTTNIDYDLGAIYYYYPGGNWSKSPFIGANERNSLNTAEVYVSAAYKGVTVKAGRAMTEYFGWSPNNSPVNGGFAGDFSAGVEGNTKGSYYYEVNGTYSLNYNTTLIGQLGNQVVKNSKSLDIAYAKGGISYALPDDWSVGVYLSVSSNPQAYRRFVSLKNAVSGSDVARKRIYVSIGKNFK